MPASPYAPSGGPAEENERDLQRKEWSLVTTDPDTAAFHGQCARYAQRDQWNTFRSNKVSEIVMRFSISKNFLDLCWIHSNYGK